MDSHRMHVFSVRLKASLNAQNAPILIPLNDWSIQSCHFTQYLFTTGSNKAKVAPNALQL